MPTTLVHRLELMRLLYRFKGLVEWELAKLAALDGVTVPLDLEHPAAYKGQRLDREPPSVAPSSPGSTVEPSVASGTPPRPGAGAPDGTVADDSGLPGAAGKVKLRIQDPSNLESCCRSADLPTGDYVALVDAATPYVRALAEE
jgi:hypothetical protein